MIEPPHGRCPYDFSPLTWLRAVQIQHGIPPWPITCDAFRCATGEHVFYGWATSLDIPQPDHPPIPTTPA